MQRREDERHLRGQTVGHGNHTGVLVNHLGINFRYTERHLGIEAECLAAVDDHSTCIHGMLSKILTGFRIRRENRNIDVLQSIFGEHTGADRMVAKG